MVAFYCRSTYDDARADHCKLWCMCVYVCVCGGGADSVLLRAQIDLGFLMCLYGVRVRAGSESFGTSVSASLQGARL